MTPPWSDLLAAARSEVEDTIAALPVELRQPAAALPVVYERRPGKALVADGLDPDLLGLFVGDAHRDEGQGPAVPSQILLFLESLWEFAAEDWEFYAEEVQTTYLHELGHYLGLDEIDLEERGLE